MTTTTPEFELTWDSEIEDTGPSFTLLPEGNYEFEVVHWERARYEGGPKLPPCPMAVIHLRVTAPNGDSTTLQHRLFLHSRTQGLIFDFFVAIGLMQRGEKARMPWNQIVGRRGRAKVGVRTWVGNDGQERQSNQIERFYDPGEGAVPTTTAYQAGNF